MRTNTDSTLKTGRFLVRQDIRPTNEISIDTGLAVFCTGWEPRALESLKFQRLSAKNALILGFPAVDQENVCRDQLISMKSYLESQAIECTYSLMSPISSIEQNVTRLCNSVRALVDSNGPTVFIDATIVPRVILQKFVYRLFGQASVPRIIIGYAIGDYKNNLKAPDDNGGRSVLTQGDWALESVAIGRGATIAESQRNLVIVLGTETEKTLALVRNLEPYGVDVLLPNRNQSSNLDTIALHCADSLKNDPSLKAFAQHSILHADLLGATKQVLDIFRRTRDVDTLTFLGLGPKPLALAGVLANLSGHTIEVVGRIPCSYIPIEVQPTGEYAVYEIIDLCHPDCAKLPSNALEM